MASVMPEYASPSASFRSPLLDVPVDVTRALVCKITTGSHVWYTSRRAHPRWQGVPGHGSLAQLQPSLPENSPRERALALAGRARASASQISPLAHARFHTPRAPPCITDEGRRL
ncbi:hypothetical protein AAFF_G00035550 [Aldrovandia affinis]|uniref:Uncharacterized protein n=1 Tax=Aldrovandia affinis TaxID=143900 RepID=A0AAD7WGG8_9TELE|nr:hypothetical protein AAFF_G00035550 [Aldrovandia affinis]